MTLLDYRMQQSDLLVKELSDDLGFSDPFHFSRSFKRVHGISPQRFLELTQRGPREHDPSRPIPNVMGQ